MGYDIQSAQHIQQPEMAKRHESFIFIEKMSSIIKV